MDLKDRLCFVVRRYLRIPDRTFDIDSVPVRIKVLGNRIAVCKIFPEKSGSLRRYTDEVAIRLCPDRSGNEGWLALSIRIGAIAAAITEYKRSEMLCSKSIVDISVVSGDLFGPLSAYLAREMGFSVGDILCCCNENSGFWELLHHGRFRTDQVVIRSDVPEADIAIPDGLECLIALCCGGEEADRYLEAVRFGKPYVPGEEGIGRLRSAFRATVVTRSGLMRGAYVSRGVSVKAGSALALTGLLDHRAGNGSVRPALVIAE